MNIKLPSEKYIIDSKGNTTNVILTKNDFNKLMQYVEELEDIAAYDRVKESNEKLTSWNKVKR